MDNLSTPFSAWKQRLQPGKRLRAVIIGSGYGGSVAALRLVEMGYEVTLLERGSEFRPGDFPNDMSQLPKFIRAPSADGQQVSGRGNGLFEFRAGPGVLSLVGNGLGGGSLINAGVVIRPDADTFTQESWPAALRLPAGIPANDAEELPGMDHWFKSAEAALEARDWPYRKHTKSRAFDHLAQQVRFPNNKERKGETSKVSVTIDASACIDCGDCATGCNHAGAKLSLRDTYLKQAHQSGATLVNGASAWTITPLRQSTRNGHGPADAWRIRVLETSAVSRWPSWQDAATGEGIDIEAELLVLAAGTFGSTEILQRSKDRCGDDWWLSPELGNRFSGNGDSLNFMVDSSRAVGGVGAGRKPVPAPTEKQPGVGPTITRQINLRDSDREDPIPLRHRLTIEDATVPGAIARVFAELLATGLTTSRLEHWRTGPPRKGLKWFQKTLDAGLDPLGASQKLADHGQALLTMGHDESRGRIVWVPGRDASVPYWEQPEELETYRVQDQLFKKTAKRMQGEWVPNPAWRLLPESASTMMSGPTPPRTITTVHPLGGCIMGDDPRRSVVDDVGRLWCSDRPTEDGSNEDWQRHDNFLILDGSVIPTALGVNPLLTITALAERAMGALKLREQGTATSESRPPPVNSPRPDRLPPPSEPRDEDPRWEVTMSERLVNERLEIKSALGTAFGQKEVGGELNLELKVRDWLDMWSRGNHPIDEVTGTLRLHARDKENDKDLVATYRVVETKCCELLAQSPCSGGVGAWLRTLATYGILRWRDLRTACRHPKPGQPGGRFKRLMGWGKSGARQFGHLAERRDMYYNLKLELVTGSDLFSGEERDGESRNFDENWTQVWRENLPRPDKLPSTLRLTGKKRVEYAATWCEIARYTACKLRNALHIDNARTQFSPQLRESFFEQASHLSINLWSWETSEEVLDGRLLMDFSHMLRNPPMRLGPDTDRSEEDASLPGGDLTAGLLSLGAYPGVFARFLVKTRLPDFRLPDYCQVPLPDVATPDQLRLRINNGETGPVPQRHVFQVPRGTTSNTGVTGDAGQTIDLVLWRYARTDNEDALPGVSQGTWHGKPVQRLKSVLLLHAYAQSGYTYTLNTLPENLAGRLYAEGYEVWVLEHRLSTRLPIHEESVTLDQIARHDLPVAVDRILDTLRGEFKARQPETGMAHPQLHVFAQCLGSASLAMSLLSGRLHYSEIRATDNPGPLTPYCPKLASVIFSQTHMMCLGQPGTQGRTWIPSFARDGLGLSSIPLGVRGPVDSMLESTLDRIFSALPIPDTEQCPAPPLGSGEDDCATCRRVRYIEAPLFKHRNLSSATHRQLPLHFGKANIGTFAQAAKCVETEALVNEDGQSVYVTDENVRKYCALPTVFLHGEENELFHPESAERTARFVERLHPDWAVLTQAALAGLPKKNKLSGSAWLVPGHGHYDVLIGEEAPPLVYPGIAGFFNGVQAVENQGNTDASSTPLHVVPHIPRVGPFIGPVQHDSNKGRFRVRVSFQVEDRFPDGKQDESGDLGTRCWAFARARCSADTPFSDHQLEIVRRGEYGDDPGSTGEEATLPGDTTNYRFAVGSIELPEEDWPTETGLDIQVFSVHEVVAPTPHSLPLHSSLYPEGTIPPGGASTPLPSWLDDLQTAIYELMLKLGRYKVPLPNTVSRVRLEAERTDLMWARVNPAARDAAYKNPSNRGADSVSFIASTCRYPGFPFDRHRAEHAVQRILPLLAGEKHPRAPAFGLLVGDQIYADATAGLVDPLSPTERYVERHREALKRSSSDTHPALGDLLANLPSVMTPDDHEYIDNYPAGAPLVMTRNHEDRQPGCDKQALAFCAARDAWRFFQRSAVDMGGRGHVSFEAGPLRILVLDTRTYRKPTSRTIFCGEQKDRIKSWLADSDAEHHLNLVATGSVAMPGLLQGMDPANPGAPDTFQWSTGDRQFLFKALTEAANRWSSFRFALLSGDYHVSLVSELAFTPENAGDSGKRPVGLSIVVPPAYAPMPYINAMPESIDFRDRVSVALPAGSGGVWTPEELTPQICDPAGNTLPPHGSVLKGSAIASITVTRTGEKETPYALEWRADLRDYERCGPVTAAKINIEI